MSSLAPEPFSLKKALTFSLFTHLLVITLILFHSHLSPRSRTFRASVYRVNLVSLPPPPAPPSPAPKVAAKSPPASPASPSRTGTRVVKKAPQPAPAKVKKPAPPPSPPPAQDRSQELAQAIAAVKNDLVSKIETRSQPGPVVFTPGTGRGRSDPEFQRYLENLSEKIKSSWIYPSSSPGRRTVITIKIARDGEILAAGIEESSGDSAYDASALRAVEKIKSLPPLPTLRYGHPLEIGLRF